MADFSIAFNYMIQNEDYAPTDPRYGKTNIDNDGGKVRFGVNSNSMGKDLLNTTFYTTMPNDEAIKLVSNLYNINEWREVDGDSITSQRVASKIFDLSVNEGVKEASKLVQRACGVNVDGCIGSITIKAINNCAEDMMLKNLIYWNLWFIDQVIHNHPEYEKYKEEWIQRAKKLPL